MRDDTPGASSRPSDVLLNRHTRAWFLLVGALALHVLDEAATGFLDFYNPLIRDLRLSWPWLPMPTFEFGDWMAGLILGLLALGAFGMAVRRDRPGTILLSWLLSGLMLLNGLGHLVASLYFIRWVPGSTSAPLLLAASLLLAKRAWDRGGRAPGLR